MQGIVIIIAVLSPFVPHSVGSHLSSNLDLLSSYCLNDLEPALSYYQPQLSLTPADAFAPIQSSNHSSWVQLPHTAPWTYPPVCAADQSLREENGELFCVFSSHSFTAGRGISLITTPAIAASILASPAFENGAKKHYTAPSFVAQEVPGKGIGLFANRTLYRGDRILGQTPLMVIHGDLYNKSVMDTGVRQRLNEIGVEWMTRESKKLFYDMMGHFGGNPIDDRIDTNSFEVEIDGVQHLAIFPETARMNHDCRPNAMYFFDPASLAHFVHAGTTIRSGEELTVTYINPREKREDRMQNLHSSWGFSCSCSTCSLPRPLADESDERLQEMQSLTDLLSDWTPGVEVDPNAGDLLISLYEQERLHIARAFAYQLAAQNWNAVGQKYKAVRNARMAIDLGMIDDGPHDQGVQDMIDLVESPEEHWTWRKRVRSFY